MGYNDDWKDDDISKPENPNAFPRPYSYDETEAFHYLAHPGMSLRDWFAGQALIGLLSRASGEDPHKAPGLAFKLADDMLAERDK